MLSVKVSTKHQIVVPSEARAKLGIVAGDRLDVRVGDDELVITKQPRRASDRLRGMAEGRGWYGTDPVGFVRELRDEWEERSHDRSTRLDRRPDRAAPTDRAGQQRPDLPDRGRRSPG